MIKDTKKIGITLIMVTMLLLSACSTQLDIQGEVSQGNDSGSVDLDIGIGDSNESGNSDQSGSQQNEQLTLQSDGLLILIGLGVLVMIGLLFGLTRNKAS